MNIVREALDRWVDTGAGERVALRCVAPDGLARSLSYRQLAEQVRRCAGALARLGLARGETVAVLLERRPEVAICGLAALRLGAVFCPLLAGLGTEPIRQRLVLGDAKMLITTPELYLRNVAPQRGTLPGLRHVILVEAPASPIAGTLILSALLAEAPPGEIAATTA
ncbi:MAG: AMP-binding protein, partial [Rhodospirillales bacterium]|nr:AMP-binding protein [Rhodospirillales bacterium]